MKYSQQKFDNGEYTPDSLYGQFREVNKRFQTHLDKGFSPTCSSDYYRLEVLEKNIAQVEARVGELQKNLTDGLPEDSEEAYDMGVEDGEIRALTILLEGEKK